MALYELGEMIATCASGRARPADALQDRLHARLRAAARARTPAARAPARRRDRSAPSSSTALIEGTIKLDRLPAELQAAADAYRRTRLRDATSPPTRATCGLHTGHLMWVRPEEERS